MSNSVDTIVVFGEAPAEEKSGPVATDHHISGDPQHKVLNYYLDSSRQYRAGVWESTAGKWHAFAGRNEFCYMISGRVRLTDKAGNSKTLGPGDSYVIKPEFNGTWEVLEDAKKLYVIYEPHQ